MLSRSDPQFQDKCIIQTNELLHSSRNRTFTTGVEESTPHPIWRTKHLFTDLERDELNASQLEISVWNYSNAVKHECLGKSNISVQSRSFVYCVLIGQFPLLNTKLEMNERGPDHWPNLFPLGPFDRQCREVPK